MHFRGLDPDTLYQEQLKEQQLCTRTQHLDASNTVTFTESTGLVLSLTRTAGSLSQGNGSAAGSDQGRSENVHNVQRPVLVTSHLRSLPSIDEVDSPEKNQDCVTEPMKISPHVVEQVEDAVTELVTFSSLSCKVGVELELEERIRKLREEDAEFERVEKLRQEATELERRKKLREEAAQVDRVTCRADGVTRAVVKVPQPPPLKPPFDNENAENKRKTRSDIAAEEEAKEVQAAKKKSKKTKKK